MAFGDVEQVLGWWSRLSAFTESPSTAAQFGGPGARPNPRELGRLVLPSLESLNWVRSIGRHRATLPLPGKASEQRDARRR